MKFLEGKTPAERNKTIAAIVLGFLAFVVIVYNFLPSSPKKPKTADSNDNSNKIVATNGGSSNSAQPQIPTVEERINDDPYYALTAIPEDPFPPVFGGGTSRNIFAIYVPPPPQPRAPEPVPEPSPVPTPPILVQFVNSNPNPVYARQNAFTIDVTGDKFTPDAKVLFNGQELPTKFEGPQRMTAQVSAALVATEGQKQIMVRTSDGSKISNPMIFNVLAPPVPNYNFVGLVSPKRYNNVTALLQDKQSREYKNVRLGEAVGRFKVVSISDKEVIMQDTALSFRHNLLFMDEKMAARAGGNSGRPNNIPQGYDPNVQNQYQQIPGIPNQYVQPQQMPPMQKPSPPRDENEGEDTAEDVAEDGDN